MAKGSQSVPHSATHHAMPVATPVEITWRAAPSRTEGRLQNLSPHAEKVALLVRERIHSLRM